MSAPKMSHSVNVFTQLVLFALLGVIGIDGKPPSAILDGDFAGDNEFPHQVSLVVLDQHICGGSIIDSLHILTTAHCIYKGVNYTIANMTVVAGTNYVNSGQGQNYHVKNATIHPEYSNSESDPWINDIAVITLSSPIIFDSRHKVINLPTSDTPAETRVTVCGWGVTTFPHGDTPYGLRKLSMVVVLNSECRPAEITYIRETQICAYSSRNASICTGDSGGPLLNDGTIVGIASFMLSCRSGFPDVFTRVYKYVDWINEVTAMY